MFDTMTVTKVVGGFCGTFLIFLLGGWVGETLYHVGESGHGDEVHQAYTIEVEDSETDAEPEPEIDFAEVYAAADASVRFVVGSKGVKWSSSMPARASSGAASDLTTTASMASGFSVREA